MGQWGALDDARKHSPTVCSLDRHRLTALNAATITWGEHCALVIYRVSRCDGETSTPSRSHVAVLPATSKDERRCKEPKAGKKSKVGHHGNHVRLHQGGRLDNLTRVDA